mmetsp:Transcript_105605/g.147218  ORF Transcript_105605/g.147218 Transcript_105605/m.147218 type:complete len:234 (-) Transcript_105605:17-718(-)
MQKQSTFLQLPAAFIRLHRFVQASVCMEHALALCRMESDVQLSGSNLATNARLRQSCSLSRHEYMEQGVALTPGIAMIIHAVAPTIKKTSWNKLLQYLSRRRNLLLGLKHFKPTCHALDFIRDLSVGRLLVLGLQQVGQGVPYGIFWQALPIVLQHCLRTTKSRFDMIWVECKCNVSCCFRISPLRWHLLQIHSSQIGVQRTPQREIAGIRFCIPNSLDSLDVVGLGFAEILR